MKFVNHKLVLIMLFFLFLSGVLYFNLFVENDPEIELNQTLKIVYNLSNTKNWHEKCLVCR